MFQLRTGFKPWRALVIFRDQFVAVDRIRLLSWRAGRLGSGHLKQFWKQFRVRSRQQESIPEVHNHSPPRSHPERTTTSIADYRNLHQSCLQRKHFIGISLSCIAEWWLFIKVRRQRRWPGWGRCLTERIGSFPSYCRLLLSGMMGQQRVRWHRWGLCDIASLLSSPLPSRLNILAMGNLVFKGIPVDIYYRKSVFDAVESKLLKSVLRLVDDMQLIYPYSLGYSFLNNALNSSETVASAAFPSLALSAFVRSISSTVRWNR